MFNCQPHVVYASLCMFTNALIRQQQQQIPILSKLIVCRMSDRTEPQHRIYYASTRTV